MDSGTATCDTKGSHADRTCNSEIPAGRVRSRAFPVNRTPGPRPAPGVDGAPERQTVQPSIRTERRTEVRLTTQYPPGPPNGLGSNDCSGYCPRPLLFTGGPATPGAAVTTVAS